MDNQHQKISGYRELDQSEIDAMNYLKAQEAAILDYLNELSGITGQHIHGRGGQTVPVMRHDQRWLSIARTHIQQGFMAACRAVARPGE